MHVQTNTSSTVALQIDSNAILPFLVYSSKLQTLLAVSLDLTTNILQVDPVDGSVTNYFEFPNDGTRDRVFLPLQSLMWCRIHLHLMMDQAITSYAKSLLST